MKRYELMSKKELMNFIPESEASYLNEEVELVCRFENFHSDVELKKAWMHIQSSCNKGGINGDCNQCIHSFKPDCKVRAFIDFLCEVEPKRKE